MDVKRERNNSTCDEISSSDPPESSSVCSSNSSNNLRPSASVESINSLRSVDMSQYHVKDFPTRKKEDEIKKRVINTRVSNYSNQSSPVKASATSTAAAAASIQRSSSQIRSVVSSSSQPIPITKSCSSHINSNVMVNRSPYSFLMTYPYPSPCSSTASSCIPSPSDYLLCSPSPTIQISRPPSLVSSPVPIPVSPPCLKRHPVYTGHYSRNRDYYHHIDLGRRELESDQIPVFTSWINHFVPGLISENLIGELRDGTKILTLLQYLTGQYLPSERGETKAHFLSNVKRSLQVLEERNITTTNINALDVVNGDEKVILGLVWTIILNFSNNQLAPRERPSSVQSIITNTASKLSHSTDDSKRLVSQTLSGRQLFSLDRLKNSPSPTPRSIKVTSSRGPPRIFASSAAAAIAVTTAAVTFSATSSVTQSNCNSLGDSNCSSTSSAASSSKGSRVSSSSSSSLGTSATVIRPSVIKAIAPLDTHELTQSPLQTPSPTHFSSNSSFKQVKKSSSTSSPSSSISSSCYKVTSQSTTELTSAVGTSPVSNEEDKLKSKVKSCSEISREVDGENLHNFTMKSNTHKSDDSHSEANEPCQGEKVEGNILLNVNKSETMTPTDEVEDDDDKMIPFATFQGSTSNDSNNNLQGRSESSDLHIKFTNKIHFDSDSDFNYNSKIVIPDEGYQILDENITSNILEHNVVDDDATCNQTDDSIFDRSSFINYVPPCGDNYPSIESTDDIEFDWRAAQYTSEAISDINTIDIDYDSLRSLASPASMSQTPPPFIVKGNNGKLTHTDHKRLRVLADDTLHTLEEESSQESLQSCYLPREETHSSRSQENDEHEQQLTVARPPGRLDASSQQSQQDTNVTEENQSNVADDTSLNNAIYSSDDVTTQQVTSLPFVNSSEENLNSILPLCNLTEEAISVAISERCKNEEEKSKDYLINTQGEKVTHRGDDYASVEVEEECTSPLVISNVAYDVADSSLKVSQETAHHPDDSTQQDKYNVKGVYSETKTSEGSDKDVDVLSVPRDLRDTKTSVTLTSDDEEDEIDVKLPHSLTQVNEASTQLNRGSHETLTVPCTLIKSINDSDELIDDAQESDIIHEESHSNLHTMASDDNIKARDDLKGLPTNDSLAESDISLSRTSPTDAIRLSLLKDSTADQVDEVDAFSESVRDVESITAANNVISSRSLEQEDISASSTAVAIEQADTSAGGEKITSELEPTAEPAAIFSAVTIQADRNDVSEKNADEMQYELKQADESSSMRKQAVDLKTPTDFAVTEEDRTALQSAELSLPETSVEDTATKIVDSNRATRSENLSTESTSKRRSSNSERSIELQSVALSVKQETQKKFDGERSEAWPEKIDVSGDSSRDEILSGEPRDANVPAVTIKVEMTASASSDRTDVVTESSILPTPVTAVTLEPTASLTSIVNEPSELYAGEEVTEKDVAVQPDPVVVPAVIGHEDLQMAPSKTSLLDDSSSNIPTAKNESAVTFTGQHSLDDTNAVQEATSSPTTHQIESRVISTVEKSDEAASVASETVVQKLPQELPVADTRVKRSAEDLATDYAPDETTSIESSGQASIQCQASDVVSSDTVRIEDTRPAEATSNEPSSPLARTTEVISKSAKSEQSILRRGHESSSSEETTNKVAVNQPDHVLVHEVVVPKDASGQEDLHIAPVTRPLLDDNSYMNPTETNETVVTVTDQHSLHDTTAERAASSSQTAQVASNITSSVSHAAPVLESSIETVKSEEIVAPVVDPDADILRQSREVADETFDIAACTNEATRLATVEIVEAAAVSAASCITTSVSTVSPPELELTSPSQYKSIEFKNEEPEVISSTDVFSRRETSADITAATSNIEKVADADSPNNFAVSPTTTDTTGAVNQAPQDITASTSEYLRHDTTHGQTASGTAVDVENTAIISTDSSTTLSPEVDVQKSAKEESVSQRASKNLSAEVDNKNPESSPAPEAPSFSSINESTPSTKAAIIDTIVSEGIDIIPAVGHGDAGNQDDSQTAPGAISLLDDSSSIDTAKKNEAAVTEAVQHSLNDTVSQAAASSLTAHQVNSRIISTADESDQTAAAIEEVDQKSQSELSVAETRVKRSAEKDVEQSTTDHARDETACVDSPHRADIQCRTSDVESPETVRMQDSQLSSEATSNEPSTPLVPESELRSEHEETVTLILRTSDESGAAEESIEKVEAPVTLTGQHSLHDATEVQAALSSQTAHQLDSNVTSIATHAAPSTESGIKTVEPEKIVVPNVDHDAEVLGRFKNVAEETAVDAVPQPVAVSVSAVVGHENASSHEDLRVAPAATSLIDDGSSTDSAKKIESAVTETGQHSIHEIISVQAASSLPTAHQHDSYIKSTDSQEAVEPESSIETLEPPEVVESEAIPGTNVLSRSREVVDETSNLVQCTKEATSLAAVEMVAATSTSTDSSTGAPDPSTEMVVPEVEIETATASYSKSDNQGNYVTDSKTQVSRTSSTDAIRLSLLKDSTADQVDEVDAFSESVRDVESITAANNVISSRSIEQDDIAASSATAAVEQVDPSACDANITSAVDEVPKINSETRAASARDDSQSSIDTQEPKVLSYPTAQLEPTIEPAVSSMPATIQEHVDDVSGSVSAKIQCEMKQTNDSSSVMKQTVELKTPTDSAVTEEDRTALQSAELSLPETSVEDTVANLVDSNRATHSENLSAVSTEERQSAEPEKVTLLTTDVEKTTGFEVYHASPTVISDESNSTAPSDSRDETSTIESKAGDAQTNVEKSADVASIESEESCLVKTQVDTTAFESNDGPNAPTEGSTPSARASTVRSEYKKTTTSIHREGDQSGADEETENGTVIQPGSVVVPCVIGREHAGTEKGLPMVPAATSLIHDASSIDLAEKNEAAVTETGRDSVHETTLKQDASSSQTAHHLDSDINPTANESEEEAAAIEKVDQRLQQEPAAEMRVKRSAEEDVEKSAFHAREANTFVEQPRQANISCQTSDIEPSNTVSMEDSRPSVEATSKESSIPLSHATELRSGQGETVILQESDQLVVGQRPVREDAVAHTEVVVVPSVIDQDNASSQEDSRVAPAEMSPIQDGSFIDSAGKNRAEVTEPGLTSLDYANADQAASSPPIDHLIDSKIISNAPEPASSVKKVEPEKIMDSKVDSEAEVLSRSRQVADETSDIVTCPNESTTLATVEMMVATAASADSTVSQSELELTSSPQVATIDSEGHKPEVTSSTEASSRLEPSSDANAATSNIEEVTSAEPINDSAAPTTATDTTGPPKQAQQDTAASTSDLSRSSDQSAVAIDKVDHKLQPDLPVPESRVKRSAEKDAEESAIDRSRDETPRVDLSRQADTSYQASDVVSSDTIKMGDSRPRAEAISKESSPIATDERSEIEETVTSIVREGDQSDACEGTTEKDAAINTGTVVVSAIIGQEDASDRKDLQIPPTSSINSSEINETAVTVTDQHSVHDATVVQTASSPPNAKKIGSGVTSTAPHTSAESRSSVETVQPGEVVESEVVSNSNVLSRSREEAEKTSNTATCTNDATTDTTVKTIAATSQITSADSCIINAGPMVPLPQELELANIESKYEEPGVISSSDVIPETSSHANAATSDSEKVAAENLTPGVDETFSEPIIPATNVISCRSIEQDDMVSSSTAAAVKQADTSAHSVKVTSAVDEVNKIDAETHAANAQDDSTLPVNSQEPEVQPNPAAEIEPTAEPATIFSPATIQNDKSGVSEKNADVKQHEMKKPDDSSTMRQKSVELPTPMTSAANEEGRTASQSAEPLLSEASVEDARTTLNIVGSDESTSFKDPSIESTEKRQSSKPEKPTHLTTDVKKTICSEGSHASPTVISDEATVSRENLPVVDHVSSLTREIRGTETTEGSSIDKKDTSPQAPAASSTQSDVEIIQAADEIAASITNEPQYEDPLNAQSDEDTIHISPHHSNDQLTHAPRTDDTLVPEVEVEPATSSLPINEQDDPDNHLTESEMSLSRTSPTDAIRQSLLKDSTADQVDELDAFSESVRDVESITAASNNVILTETAVQAELEQIDDRMILQEELEHNSQIESIAIDKEETDSQAAVISRESTSIEEMGRTFTIVGPVQSTSHIDSSVASSEPSLEPEVSIELESAGVSVEQDTFDVHKHSTDGSTAGTKNIVASNVSCHHSETQANESEQAAVTIEKVDQKVQPELPVAETRVKRSAEKDVEQSTTDHARDESPRQADMQCRASDVVSADTVRMEDSRTKAEATSNESSTPSNRATKVKSEQKKPITSTHLEIHHLDDEPKTGEKTTEKDAIPTVSSQEDLDLAPVTTLRLDDVSSIDSAEKDEAIVSGISQHSVHEITSVQAASSLPTAHQLDSNITPTASQVAVETESTIKTVELDRVAESDLVAKAPSRSREAADETFDIATCTHESTRPSTVGMIAATSAPTESSIATYVSTVSQPELELTSSPQVATIGSEGHKPEVTSSTDVSSRLEPSPDANTATSNIEEVTIAEPINDSAVPPTTTDTTDPPKQAPRDTAASTSDFSRSKSDRSAVAIDKVDHKLQPELPVAEPRVKRSAEKDAEESVIDCARDETSRVDSSCQADTPCQASEVLSSDTIRVEDSLTAEETSHHSSTSPAPETELESKNGKTLKSIARAGDESSAAEETTEKDSLDHPGSAVVPIVTGHEHATSQEDLLITAPAPLIDDSSSSNSAAKKETVGAETGQHAVCEITSVQAALSPPAAHRIDSDLSSHGPCAGLEPENSVETVEPKRIVVPGVDPDAEVLSRSREVADETSDIATCTNESTKLSTVEMVTAPADSCITTAVPTASPPEQELTSPPQVTTIECKYEEPEVISSTGASSRLETSPNANVATSNIEKVVDAGPLTDFAIPSAATDSSDSTKQVSLDVRPSTSHVRHSRTAGKAFETKRLTDEHLRHDTTHKQTASDTAVDVDNAAIIPTATSTTLSSEVAVEKSEQEESASQRVKKDLLAEVETKNTESPLLPEASSCSAPIESTSLTKAVITDSVVSEDIEAKSIASTIDVLSVDRGEVPSVTLTHEDEKCVEKASTFVLNASSFDTSNVHIGASSTGAFVVDEDMSEHDDDTIHNVPSISNYIEPIRSTCIIVSESDDIECVSDIAPQIDRDIHTITEVSEVSSVSELPCNLLQLPTSLETISEGSYSLSPEGNADKLVTRSQDDSSAVAAVMIDDTGVDHATQCSLQLNEDNDACESDSTDSHSIDRSKVSCALVTHSSNSTSNDLVNDASCERVADESLANLPDFTVDSCDGTHETQLAEQYEQSTSFFTKDDVNLAADSAAVKQTKELSTKEDKVTETVDVDVKDTHPGTIVETAAEVGAIASDSGKDSDSIGELDEDEEEENHNEVPRRLAKRSVDKEKHSTKVLRVESEEDYSEVEACIKSLIRNTCSDDEEDDDEGDEIDETSFSEDLTGYPESRDENSRRLMSRYVSRVIRTSVPLQVMMLLLLGAACLVPTIDEDFTCMLMNRLKDSLDPMINYPHGPPPL